MGQEQYRSCMSKNMGGGRLKGLSKEDRRIEFCTIAKQCSKGTPYEEAKRICSLPKEPKPQKAKTKKDGAKSCEKETLELARCMMDYFEANDLYKQILNVNSVGTAMTNALMECQCQK